MAKVIQYTVREFIEKYPEQFFVLPFEVRQDLIEQPEYVVRVENDCDRVEFGFRSDNWILTLAN